MSHLVSTTHDSIPDAHAIIAQLGLERSEECPLVSVQATRSVSWLLVLHPEQLRKIWVTVLFCIAYVHHFILLIWFIQRQTNSWFSQLIWCINDLSMSNLCKIITFSNLSFPIFWNAARFYRPYILLYKCTKSNIHILYTQKTIDNIKFAINPILFYHI